MNRKQRLILFGVFVRRLVTGWIVLYVAVCLSIGGVAFAKMIFRMAAMAWFVILLVSHRKFKTVGAPKSLRFAELLLTNLAFTLLLGELSLQALAAVSGQSLMVSNTLDAHRLIPGRDYGEGLHGNSLGYPGKDHSIAKPLGVKRIAALGDSFAVGPAVAFEDNYLTALNRKDADVQVINFGVSGAGPREYYAILLADALRFNPDMVLVSVFAGNDITERMATPRHLAPEQHAVYLLCLRSWKLLREKSRKQIDLRVPHRLAGSALSPETFWQVEARRLEVCRKETSSSMQKKWNRCFQYLQWIIDTCRQRQIEVRFVIIPDEFQVNPAVLKTTMSVAKVNSVEIDVDLPQKKLTAFFAEQRVDCLDLLPIFRKHEDTYAPFDTHWNERGNHLAASEIHRWLSSTAE